VASGIFVIPLAAVHFAIMEVAALPESEFHFHSHVQIITRGKGKSAVAAAAYRAGETIKNEYDGIIHDYTKKGGIVHTEILLPSHAPAEYADRTLLWNAVEKIEKSANSQLARELDIALPAKFTREQNIALARRYVKDTFVDTGMCADLCVHDKNDGNPHMHIMLTMRPINEDGTWGGKQKKEYILDRYGKKQYDPVKRQYKCRSIPSTDWNNQANADVWRKAWEDMANAELERLGFDVRIDRRTYEEQGIEKIPTVHMGVAAMQMERRGIRTERGDMNRKIEITNNEIRQLRARINKLDKWPTEEMKNTVQPTLADVIQEILSRQGQSSLTRLRNASEVFNFLSSNNIYDMAALERKVDDMNTDVRVMGKKLNDFERRIRTLDEHLIHSNNYKEYRRAKRAYDNLYADYEAARKKKGFFAERKTQKALNVVNEYRETHQSELAMFKNAEEYLYNVLHGRFDQKKPLPITMWQKERTAKITEKDSLYREYYALKDETQKVEQIQRSVRDILHNDVPKHLSERTPKKSQGVEL
jgi:hypothetical protein